MKMKELKNYNEILKIWDKAEECNCGNEDCWPKNHRLCSICGETILFGCYEGNIDQNNSYYAWNVDHIKPRSRNGNDSIHNKQPVHIRCNRNKSNKI